MSLSVHAPKNVERHFLSLAPILVSENMRTDQQHSSILHSWNSKKRNWKSSSAPSLAFGHKYVPKFVWVNFSNQRPKVKTGHIIKISKFCYSTLWTGNKFSCMMKVQIIYLLLFRAFSLVTLSIKNNFRIGFRFILQSSYTRFIASSPGWSWWMLSCRTTNRCRLIKGMTCRDIRIFYSIDFQRALR